MPSAVLVHELPGRLRFSIQALRHNVQRATALRAQLAALPGVAAVSANALTGTLLVTHDGHTATRNQIVGTLVSTGFALSSDQLAARPVPLRATQTLGTHPLVEAAAEKLLEHLLTAFITALV
ncbi:MAG: hypothetical protein JOZ05_18285 [Acetobacteraceae bacterium]|nr:hypothetical protein [Acetobacteraceae bacterium]